MRRFSSGFPLLLFAVMICMTSSVLATGTDLQLFLGAQDTGRDNQDSVYGLQLMPGTRLTRFGLRPVYGMMRSRHESHLFYIGISRESRVRKDRKGFLMSVDIAAGHFAHGGGLDTELGDGLQFRTGISLQYEFADKTRFGLGLYHISNASIKECNPGTEIITVIYSLRWR